MLMYYIKSSDHSVLKGNCPYTHSLLHMYIELLFSKDRSIPLEMEVPMINCEIKIMSTSRVLPRAQVSQPYAKPSW